MNSETDGFDIVRQFLDNNYLIEKSILDRAKMRSACSHLALNYIDAASECLKPIPLWIIVELLPFGSFIELYTFYYQTYSKRIGDYSRYLGSIKYLRNACAHSNCLIHSLKKVEGFSKTQQIMLTLSRAKGISPQTRLHKMSVPVIHDFVTLLLVYNDILDTPQNRIMRMRRMKELRHFFIDDDGRIRTNSAYFKNNQTLAGAYEFICNVLKFIDNESHNPRAKKLLKTN